MVSVNTSRGSVHLFIFVQFAGNLGGEYSLWGKKKQRAWLNFISYGDHMGSSRQWPIQPDFDPYLPVRLSY